MRYATAAICALSALLAPIAMFGAAHAQSPQQPPQDAQHQPAAQQRQPGATSPPGPTAQQQAARTALPADVTTKHSLLLPDGRTITFTATAGSIRLTNLESGAPVADIAYIAFQLPDTDRATRPVTFAMNGGPGYASAWLNLGAMGPWRLPMDASASRPPRPP